MDGRRDVERCTTARLARNVREKMRKKNYATYIWTEPSRATMHTTHMSHRYGACRRGMSDTD